MPSTLYHINFADLIFKEFVKQGYKLEKIDFLAGNLIPDFAKNKVLTHYRKKASVEGLFVPDIELAKRELFKPDNFVIFGMFAHPFLDFYFIEEYLIPSFEWDTKNKLIINPRNNKVWKPKDFFSEKGMYGAYTKINQLLLRDKIVSMDTIDLIPKKLPSTGIDIFDNRIEKNWRKELDGYLSKKDIYTNDIFEYESFCKAISYIAEKFVREYKKYMKR